MPNFEMIPYQKTENVISDLKNIIEVAQKQAYQSVNVLLVERNWLIGKMIISRSSTTQFTTSAPVVDNCSTTSANR